MRIFSFIICVFLISSANAQIDSVKRIIINYTSSNKKCEMFYVNTDSVKNGSYQKFSKEGRLIIDGIKMEIVVEFESFTTILLESDYV